MLPKEIILQSPAGEADNRGASGVWSARRFLGGGGSEANPRSRPR
jgi:hypothetical protein